ncbi:hypothetical protein EXIGLDRAFT_473440 [Exidia glandulosa HHB12029]|uniref:Uncharacterized protein n=1 Tax=Exidia glandulosa HHB12029 TaxID=1314781 RepID=A0A166AVD7_EXIGL|nr:hypothetical protein EXIGLDRAFT_473440 [Exidia glandulosa HHB12029]
MPSPASETGLARALVERALLLQSSHLDVDTAGCDIRGQSTARSTASQDALSVRAHYACQHGIQAQKSRACQHATSPLRSTARARAANETRHRRRLMLNSFSPGTASTYSTTCPRRRLIWRRQARRLQCHQPGPLRPSDLNSNLCATRPNSRFLASTASTYTHVTTSSTPNLDRNVYPKFGTPTRPCCSIAPPTRCTTVSRRRLLSPPRAVAVPDVIDVHTQPTRAFHFSWRLDIVSNVYTKLGRLP